MAKSHVISALTAKRSELSGLLAHHKKEITRLNDEVKTVDAVIKLFEPDYCTQAIKPKRYQKKNAFFKHGEAHRMILEVLRESDKPLSTNDIAKAVMVRTGIEDAHEKTLQATVLTILHRQKKIGLVEFTGKDVRGCCVWVVG
jgi:uncharacterized protein YigA (DUF484 family)